MPKLFVLASFCLAMPAFAQTLFGLEIGGKKKFITEREQGGCELTFSHELRNDHRSYFFLFSHAPNGLGVRFSDPLAGLFQDKAPHVEYLMEQPFQPPAARRVEWNYKITEWWDEKENILSVVLDVERISWVASTQRFVHTYAIHLSADRQRPQSMRYTFSLNGEQKLVQDCRDFHE